MHPKIQTMINSKPDANKTQQCEVDACHINIEQNGGFVPWCLHAATKPEAACGESFIQAPYF
jgi:hypothetical protein